MTDHFFDDRLVFLGTEVLHEGKRNVHHELLHVDGRHNLGGQRVLEYVVGAGVEPDIFNLRQSFCKLRNDLEACRTGGLVLAQSDRSVRVDGEHARCVELEQQLKFEFQLGAGHHILLRVGCKGAYLY